MTKFAFIPQQVHVPSKPSAPEAGYSKLYRKTDGDWYALAVDDIERFAFSTNFVVLASPAVETVTTTAFTNKIDSPTGDLPAGVYEVITSFMFNSDSTAQDIIARLLIDGVSVDPNSNEILRREGVEVAGAFGATGTDQKLSYTRIDYVTFGAAGSRLIQLGFATSQAGIAASMWSAKVSLKRVQ
jgi:hypothetical protein